MHTRPDVSLLAAAVPAQSCRHHPLRNMLAPNGPADNQPDLAIRTLGCASTQVGRCCLLEARLKADSGSALLCA
jgi:hypothetical protein